jgi:hypothetical protein
MGCIKLHILDEQYERAELKVSYRKKELNSNFCAGFVNDIFCSDSQISYHKVAQSAFTKAHKELQTSCSFVKSFAFLCGKKYESTPNSQIFYHKVAQSAFTKAHKELQTSCSFVKSLAFLCGKKELKKVKKQTMLWDF